MGRAYEVRKASMQKTSIQKSKLYSRYGKELYMAARNGEPNPEMNLELKRLIEEARSAEVPNSVIERAIKKAQGKGEEVYHEVIYEGFGPASSQFMVYCLSDNHNRTAADVRHCFSKHQGNMGVNGSVAHAFQHLGLISFASNDEEKIFELLIENEIDIQDIEKEDNYLLLSLAAQDLHKAKNILESTFGKIDYDVFEIAYVPSDYINLDLQDYAEFEKLLACLNELEDVQEIYHNVTREEKS